VRYRIWLPIGHALIDCVLLVSYLWSGHQMLQREKNGEFSLVQEEGPVEWAPIYMPPPPKFQLILMGTAPAGMLSSTLRPKAGRMNRRTSWDPVWFAIHESTAIGFWFLLGWWIDSGNRTLAKTMVAYLASRVVFAILSIVAGAAMAGVALQGLFWFALLIYAVLQGLGWTIRRLSPTGQAS
jgi:hypothetical protein